MTNTKQELIAIRDGAPDEATIWCEDTNEFVAVFCRGEVDDMEYFYAVWNGKKWIECIDIHQFTLRQLDDIRARIELMEESEKQAFQIRNLKFKLKMMVSSVQHKTRLLESCEIALAERDEENEKLVAKVAELTAMIDNSLGWKDMERDL